jgi:hypothetical protein
MLWPQLSVILLEHIRKLDPDVSKVQQPFHTAAAPETDLTLR